MAGDQEVKLPNWIEGYKFVTQQISRKIPLDDYLEYLSGSKKSAILRPGLDWRNIGSLVEEQAGIDGILVFCKGESKILVSISNTNSPKGVSDGKMMYQEQKTDLSKQYLKRKKQGKKKKKPSAKEETEDQDYNPNEDRAPQLVEYKEGSVFYNRRQNVMRLLQNLSPKRVEIRLELPHRKDPLPPSVEIVENKKIIVTVDERNLEALFGEESAGRLLKKIRSLGGKSIVEEQAKEVEGEKARVNAEGPASRTRGKTQEIGKSSTETNKA